jgi:PAS domain S-box-containing protein
VPPPGLHGSVFEAILASLADNLYVFDREMRYAFVSPTAAAALQLPEDQLLGRTWRDIGLPASLMETVEGHVRSVFATGNPVRAEAQLALPDGLHHYEYTLAPVAPVSGGAIEYVTAIGRDVTARKTLESQRTEVLESISDAFFALDKDWRIVLVNSQQERVSRTARADTLGRNFWDVFPETRSPLLRYWSEYHRVMEQRVAVEFEEFYAPLKIWTAVRAFPTADGGMSVFFRDVTAVKGVEDRLSSARGFEQKIVAIVGHDIRNPLGAIELAAGRILRQDAGRDPAVTTKSAQLIQRAVERIQHIVDGLLDFTRARQGGIPIKLEKTSLDVICKEILEELHGSDAGRAVDFECEGDVIGYWDPHRLAQAISNLVGNAFQHSAPGSRVRVSVRPDDDTVTLDVHNEGDIAAEVLPTIFDPFRRGLKQHKSEGLGLGLYIADTIVRAHDGQLDVRSSADDGTTFRITLPRKPRTHARSAAE